MNGPSTVETAERIEVTGLVQGVGFRPFVHRLADELDLDGCVGNDSAKVFIEVAGPSRRIDEFVARLERDAPPLARVDRVVRGRTELTGFGAPGFRIVESAEADGLRTFVAPDTAVCTDCLAEMRDPGDRRFGHPFITCTNCGPRFTIITDLPYDRPNTTMAAFAMCSRCQAEYTDPSNRRYHAQPIACPECGPTLRWLGPAGPVETTDPVAEAILSLRRGGVVAIKGLGGFHLVCDATNPAAVARLRARKLRPDKPFAVMVARVAAARALAHLDDTELAELDSPARPIVLARARPATPIVPEVAPASPLLGVMLAYTPIHHLLFDAGSPPLVVTSANIAGEPIIHRDEEVGRLLGPVADHLLTHDRAIHAPCDDSVVRVVDGELLPVRRARGYAPIPVRLGEGVVPTLATGGELKNTFCVTSTTHAWVGPHIGDMGTLATLDAFERGVRQFELMYELAPERLAVDAHPAYTVGRWARRIPHVEIVEVQHHHAHVAAVMAEHELHPGTRVVGVAFDGTGYGSDGTVWGGEVFVGDATGFDRVAGLAPVALPGGDAAIENPYRVALALLHSTGVEWGEDLAPVAHAGRRERALLARQLDGGFGCVPTSSMGRLFDAVASLLDLRHTITYEAQAAIELEHLAREDGTGGRGYRFGLRGPVIDPGPVVRAVVADLRAGVSRPAIARGFHRAVVDATVQVASGLRADGGPSTVVCSGGVFQNALLVSETRAGLRAAGLRPLMHHLVPPNDGGLALGQAFIASHRPPPGSES